MLRVLIIFTLFTSNLYAQVVIVSGEVKATATNDYPDHEQLKTIQATVKVNEPATKAIEKKSIGTHSHTCPKGHTWSHSDHSFGSRADHMCPVCGYGPVWTQSCPDGFCPAPSRRVIRR